MSGARAVDPGTARILRRLKAALSSVAFFLLKTMFGIQADRKRYSLVIPDSTYSPWIADESFQEVYRSVRTNTMVDEFKMYELWQLAPQLRSLPGDLLEVGVWRGGSGCLIAARCKQAGVPGTVYLADTFRGVVKASDRDEVYRGGEHSDASPEDVHRLVRELDLGNVEVLVGTFPDETAAALGDALLKFCHIDVDTFESARSVTEWVWPRLVRGGVVVYDDYGDLTTPGVSQFVETQFGQPGRLLLHNLNGHAILVKLT